MDFLPLDNSGTVPRLDFRLIGDDQWIGLNATCDSIPLEASAFFDHQRSQRIADDFRPKGPTGVFLDMEWALDADWFDPDAGWRPYLPLPAAGAPEWYFQLDQSTPVDPNSIPPLHTILPHHLSTVESDLHSLEDCVLAIAKSSIFPMRGARPGNYDYDKLRGPFDSIQTLEAFGANVKRQALDYLAFLTWWTVSVTGWDAHVPQYVVDTITDLQLDRHDKRGVLLALERDWFHISIPHLLYHRVPVYYRWSEALEANERFLTLSPTVLRPFQSKREATIDGKVFARDMPELAHLFEKMKDYDDFFQRRVFDGKLAEGLSFEEDWDYAVVDFQGWMYRPICLATAFEFAKRFGSHIVRRGGRTSVIFRRWEALTDEASLARSPSTLNSSANDEIVRGSIEIREIHRSFYAPVQNQKFDPNGFPDYGSGLQRSGTVTARPLSWVDAMSSTDRNSSRSSSSGPERGRSNLRRTTRASPYPRPRSSSPSYRARYQRRGDESPITSQEQFARRLRVHDIITGNSNTWFTPIGASWSPVFLEEGVILFPDNRTQIRLRFWAICEPIFSCMRRLLELAISRGMRFILAIPFDALPLFHQQEKPNSADPTKRTYDAGFQETPLTYSKGGSAFMDQYLGKLADILRRPHARAAISMGGPTSWIAQFYGGDKLVEEFMSGPSSQVTVHHRGQVSTAPFLNMPVFHDQLSHQEIELIHGYIPLGSPSEDRWAYPTNEILEEYSNHWHGEWNQGCERIMGNIARALESGTLAPLTRREWREYLRSSNRGEHAPSPGTIPKPADFTLVENMIDNAYPIRWHGRRIRDIFIPEEFTVPSSGN